VTSRTALTDSWVDELGAERITLSVPIEERRRRLAGNPERLRALEEYEMRG